MKYFLVVMVYRGIGVDGADVVAASPRGPLLFSHCGRSRYWTSSDDSHEVPVLDGGGRRRTARDSTSDRSQSSPPPTSRQSTVKRIVDSV